MRALGCVLLATLADGSVVGRDLMVPPGHPAEVLRVTGVGVQVYVCKQMEAGPGWSFVAPEAKLMDAAGKPVGTHGAGPVWMLGDGSSVKGTMVAQWAPPEAGSVPWLLLEAREGKGPGVLGNVGWIRRSETIGGKARGEGCDAAHVGAMDRVPYRATYTFFGPEGGGH